MRRFFHNSARLDAIGSPDVPSRAAVDAERVVIYPLLQHLAHSRLLEDRPMCRNRNVGALMVAAYAILLVSQAVAQGPPGVCTYEIENEVVPFGKNGAPAYSPAQGRVTRIDYTGSGHERHLRRQDLS